MISLRPHQEECLAELENHNKGIICAVTGAGKTLIGIADTAREFQNKKNQTIVIVSPRILLTTQLSSEYLEHIDGVQILHCHSGEVSHFSTTNSDKIKNWWEKNGNSHRLIFTTYHSLHKIQESGISVNTVHFDEAHHSVRSDFYVATKYLSENSDRCYFYTATPKYSSTSSKPGMNEVNVYGNIIANISAPRMVREGYIIPPKITAKPIEFNINNVFERDCYNLLQTIDDNNTSKILVCAKSTRQILGLITHTSFSEEIKEREYSLMIITSKTGAMIDGKKVNREVFFDTLHKWSQDDSKKFILLHYSILSEGINVSGLESVIFMRSMTITGICQTIGRVVRLHHQDAKNLKNGQLTPGNLDSYKKSHGLVVIPTFNNATQAIAKKVQGVVDTVFERGEPAIMTIKK